MLRIFINLNCPLFIEVVKLSNITRRRSEKKKQSIIETRVIIKVKKAPLTKQNKKYKEILSMKKGENCK